MTKIINANNEKWTLIEKDGYTLVDCGKKVKRLPFNISQTIEFFYKIGIMKRKQKTSKTSNFGVCGV